MRVFKSILKMSLKRECEYKSAMFSGMATQVFFGLMQIALYTSFLLGGQEDFTVAQMASYIWLQQCFYTLFKYWDCQKFEISQKIVNGDTCYQLIKPISTYSLWYYKVFSRSVSMVTLRCVPVLVLAFLLPANMGLMLPVSIENFVLFLISFAIGALLVCSINMISYILVLYTLSPSGVFAFMVAVCTFLAGQTVPIPMLPKGVQKVFNFLPFRYASDLPFRIYIGNICGTSALIQIAIQIAWLVLIVLVGRFVISKKLNKLVVQGG